MASLAKAEEKKEKGPCGRVPDQHKMALIGPTHLNARFKKELNATGRIPKKFIIQFCTVEDFRKFQDAQGPEGRLHFAAVLHDCDKNFPIDQLKEAANRMSDEKGAVTAVNHFLCRFKKQPKASNPSFPNPAQLGTAIDEMKIYVRRVTFEDDKDLEAAVRYCAARYRSATVFRDVFGPHLKMLP